MNRTTNNEQRTRHGNPMSARTRRRSMVTWILVMSVMASSPLHAQSLELLPLPPPGGDASISLDLKGVDILDVLKLLSQKGNLSFVAGRNLTGRVTLFVKDVALWEAFEVIVAANDLAYERRGDLITVLTARDYELLYGEKFQDRKAVEIVSLRYAKAASVATVLNQLKSNVGRVVVDEASSTVILVDLPGKVEQLRTVVSNLDVPTQTYVWELQYATVADIQPQIEAVLTPNIGTLQTDVRTNKLIVTDLPSVIATVDSMVRAFDAKTRQVLIESKIVQVTLTDTQTMGIDWKAVLSALDSDTRASFDNLGDVLGGAVKGWALRYTGSNVALTVLLEALQSVGKTDIVSSPSIAVTEGQEAKILIGTKEAFVTTTVVTPGGGSPTTSAEQVTFVDVGVNLTVTPMIKSDGFVSLKIRPEVSSVDRALKTAQGNEIPIVKTSEVDTNVLLKSGTTIIIGGLIEDRVEKTQDKIPLLGDLPLLKHAFRSAKDTLKKTETIIFLTPYIISGDEPLLEFEQVAEKAPAAAKQLATTPLAYETSSGESVTPAYRQALQQRLQRALVGAYAGLQRPAQALVVTLTVRRDGSLVGMPLIEGSDDHLLRQRTREAIEAAAPFPAFPPGTRLSDIRFRLPIEYRGE